MLSELEPVFVDLIPRELEEGKLYISEVYATASHRCCCGCSQRVVTPLSPTDWRLEVDSGQVTLWPSIGNWNFPCQSHYWIESNRVRWSYQMTQDDIAAGRRADAEAKARYHDTARRTSDPVRATRPDPAVSKTKRGSLWGWARSLFRR